MLDKFTKTYLKILSEDVMKGKGDRFAACRAALEASGFEEDPEIDTPKYWLRYVWVDDPTADLSEQNSVDFSCFNDNDEWAVGFSCPGMYFDLGEQSMKEVMAHDPGIRLPHGPEGFAELVDIAIAEASKRAANPDDYWPPDPEEMEDYEGQLGGDAKERSAEFMEKAVQKLQELKSNIQQ